MGRTKLTHRLSTGPHEAHYWDGTSIKHYSTHDSDLYDAWVLKNRHKEIIKRDRTSKEQHAWDLRHADSTYTVARKFVGAVAAFLVIVGIWGDNGYFAWVSFVVGFVIILFITAYEKSSEGKGCEG